MKTILITGHTGFIGNHLTHHLQKQYNIIGLSNISQKELNIKQIRGDINKIRFNQIPKNISTIIHLAAISDVQYCQKNPSQTSMVNILGTQNILELARKKDSKLIFMSTSHIYGKPKKLPILETHSKNPTSIYATTKLAGETLCKSYSDTYGIDVGIARLFSVYGPCGPKHSLINSIMTQINNSQDLKLGNITSKRDFVFISDVVSAIEKIIKNNRHFDAFNIGTGKKTSVLQLCNLLNKIARKKVSIKSVKSKLQKNDIPELVADIKKIKKLGWAPKIHLNDGLKITFESHYKKNKN